VRAGQSDDSARVDASPPAKPGTRSEHGKLVGTLSPKRPQVDTAGLADIFPYYAGFSFDWACKTLISNQSVEAAIVLDPWNGSGTTTLAASRVGMPSIGIDLNPVANIVAKLRAINSQPAPMQFRSGELSPVADGDPLLSWFDRETATTIREWSIASSQQTAETRSLVLAAIFRVVRKLTQNFQGSNPTWVRKISSDRSAINCEVDVFDSLMLEEQDAVRERISTDTQSAATISIIRGNANDLPISSGVVDVVLTSPPYLTRIDYAVAYSRELAILGIDITADRTLRGQLMGTTLIRKMDARNYSFQGESARNLISSISQACQYLDDLNRGFDEISRVCKIGASATFVVQDSYYKDIPIPLADICEEAAVLRGWKLVEKQPFEVGRTLVSLNSSARSYTKSPVNETVITLEYHPSSGQLD